MENESLWRELYRARLRDKIAHGVVVACLVALIVTFGAIMFYLGRVSVDDVPAAPQKLTVAGRVA